MLFVELSTGNESATETTYGADMSQYIIYFNQQWVGDHSEEWFTARGPLANAVVEEMKEAGVYVFAGGVDEDLANGFSADATSGKVEIADGLFGDGKEYLGGLTVIDVPDDDTAKVWAGKIAVACGWPQQVRQVG
ncbi:YciI family protein [Kribbella sp. NPDC048928]|uniref:YciI family protein n=1 Tax=Kribbella sp. NPDC048928 TaxID=3364111 RepID=UPI003722071E